MKKGRPKENHVPQLLSTKFTREFNSSSGTRSVWTYDLDITTRGPISVSIFYPPGFKSQVEVEEKLPKTKRTYLNVNNGKFVKYYRAVQLGLIK